LEKPFGREIELVASDAFGSAGERRAEPRFEAEREERRRERFEGDARSEHGFAAFSYRAEVDRLSQPEPEIRPADEASGVELGRDGGGESRTGRARKERCIAGWQRYFEASTERKGVARLDAKRRPTEADARIAHGRGSERRGLLRSNCLGAGSFLVRHERELERHSEPVRQPEAETESERRRRIHDVDLATFRIR
jgi:hypothetical protein